MDWSLKHSTPYHHQLRLAQQQHERRHHLDSRYSLSTSATSATSSSTSASSGRDSDEICKCEAPDDAFLAPSSLLSRSNSLSGVYIPDRFSTDPGYASIVGAGSSGPAHAASPSHSYASPSAGSALHPHDTSSFGFSASAAIDPLSGSSLHSLDLQHFDETASVDLQQLFPAGSATGHASHALGAMASSVQQQQQQQQQLAHTDSMNYYTSAQPSTDYFGEGTSPHMSDSDDLEHHTLTHCCLCALYLARLPVVPQRRCAIALVPATHWLAATTAAAAAHCEYV